jgi:hypothetical protein
VKIIGDGNSRKEQQKCASQRTHCYQELLSLGTGKARTLTERRKSDRKPSEVEYQFHRGQFSLISNNRASTRSLAISEGLMLGDSLWLHGLLETGLNSHCCQARAVPTPAQGLHEQHR